VFLTLLVLLLGAGVAAGSWYLVSGRYSRVSDVIGQPQGIATQALLSQGFKVAPNVTRAYSETVPAGNVISTSPGQSARLVHGQTVSLTVSQGQERFAVAQVAGQTLAAAQASLTKIPVTVVPSNAASDTVAVGKVIRTDPVAGTKVKRDQLITVYVSTGPPVLAVPDVRGSTQAAADQAISKAGFKPVNNTDFSDTVPVGVVISQNPTPPANAVKFSAVSIVVSKGPEMVTIPDIAVGSDATVALSTLTGLGLNASITKQHKSIFDFSDYKNQVVSLDPSAGTSVRVGTDVVIHAN
jgi:eukaryotic-like serine/threonine-protein kinase